MQLEKINFKDKNLTKFKKLMLKIIKFRKILKMCVQMSKLMKI